MLTDATRAGLQHLPSLDALLASGAVRLASEDEVRRCGAAEAPYVGRALGDGATRYVAPSTDDDVLIRHLVQRLEPAVWVFRWFRGSGEQLVAFEKEVFISHASLLLQTQARVFCMDSRGNIELAFDDDLFAGTWFY